ncbi:hypothetical protein DFA_12204 [Cavenderia fasciculata]|uniref:Uncharacterized protein n=1 Tax=Cavenderia fasciculata TaxID=261658 RepID=F4QCK4_CACFS|nr:uncharacterized protein DFA_12204 [Cavenderia fasciculata]EGG14432.1 hypothetical protein DFA_12204 [Cavenderia fasciculata]|eukprot:XP_004353841.1 hypothetical protein DFA_12204 [Cavenderia fasciculata]
MRLVKLHDGATSEKALNVFGKIYNVVLLSCTLETDWIMLDHRIFLATDLITEMASGNLMTFGQTKSTMDIFLKLEKIFAKNRVVVDYDEDDDDDNQDEMDHQEFDEDLDVLVDVINKFYSMLGEMVKINSTVMMPLITSDILKRACEFLQEEGDSAEGILTFMTQYFRYCGGGKSVIKVFSHFIPTIIGCLEIPDSDVRQNAVKALIEASKIAKDKFSPWAMDALVALDTINDQDITEYVISAMSTIIQNVPLPSNDAHVIIPKWFN